MCVAGLMDVPGPRWKKGKDGEDFAALAAVNPMSGIVVQLQASLRACECVAVLSGCNGVLHVGAEQAALLSRSAFGQPAEPASTAGDAAKQRFSHFQVGSEEMLYPLHALKCVSVVKPERKEKKVTMNEEEVWEHLRSARPAFPELYKAYSHLRRRNWVVRSGLQYGADFVAYRHHPALVHSEYAVIVVGSHHGDLLCALRAAGSAAKTLLVLTVVCGGGMGRPDCLRELAVHERVITRWVLQQCSEEDQCGKVGVTSPQD
ncbi:probable tRNA-splicing endonuclease subunit Sen2 [Phragmites australis]|uniref:probable tRNA-splicing endonuclease subunit Sen2 n=1 Tax=Phragmites australis TaxID=29695 RepID=UPI002D7791D5|nr:probable tRNA-splicing endonuclease subunit Sen2 [Phragmites australis]